MFLALNDVEIRSFFKICQYFLHGALQLLLVVQDIRYYHPVHPMVQPAVGCYSALCNTLKVLNRKNLGPFLFF